jgi:hypothetical protein
MTRSSFIRPFSERSSQFQHQNSRSEIHKTARPHANPEDPHPSFSFADLGATRTVKITVLVALSIFGTLETIFWAKALWRYFVPPESSASSASSNDGSLPPS